jgi:hypothetical protein
MRVGRAVAEVSLLALVACSGSPPAPVPVASASPPAARDDLRPLSSRETPLPNAPGEAGASATSVDPVDPAEPGIPDLARLARYVFRTMRTHTDTCAFENPYRDRIHFVVEVEVKGGRMTRVGLRHAAIGAEDRSRELTAAQVPRDLVAYVECLSPHLRAVVMSPSPADGVYEPVYQYAGMAAGRVAP